MKNFLFFNLIIWVILFNSGLSQTVPTASLQLWLKADAGVDTLNGTVSRWHDQSGNGNDAIESVTSRQPVLVNNELNGKPVLRFDGENDRLGFTGSKPMTQISLFMVFKNKSGVTGIPATYPGFVVLFGSGSDYTANQHFSFKMRGFDNTDNTINIGIAGNRNNITQATAPNIATYDEWRNINVITDSTLFNTTVRWNGNDASMITIGNDFPISFQLGDSTGSGGGIGSTDNFPDLGTVRAKCDIAELIVYDTALSNTDRLAIEQYLDEKYNVAVGIEDEQSVTLPKEFILNQNYPNPFNPSTTIKYSIPQTSFVTLKIYDNLGREVTSLVNAELLEGAYAVKFESSNLSSGVYFYRITAGKFVDTKKFMILK